MEKHPIKYTNECNWRFFGFENRSVLISLTMGKDMTGFCTYWKVLLKYTNECNWRFFGFENRSVLIILTMGKENLKVGMLAVTSLECGEKTLKVCLKITRHRQTV